MTAFTLPLADPSATLENVGGKGASLARLTQAGLPVPTGFHISTQAYRLFVDHNDLQPLIAFTLSNCDPADPDALEAASSQIRARFGEGQIPAAITAEIGSAYSRLDGSPVAVRSSATAEDLPEASFAGQQETYLNIHGIEAVLQAVKNCWASLWTARAIAYRSRQNIAPEGVALAVVVQELVCADAAGVMFTANPINGKRDELVITAAWGLGESIVSGVVTPDTLTVDRTSLKVTHRAIAEKHVMTIRNPSGTEESPVPAKLRAKAVLNDRQASQIAQLGIVIDRLYGTPMDIEWTLKDDSFAILQARPITALPPEPPPWVLPNPKARYARGSLCEHLPNPVSPLFATLGLRAVNRATAEMTDWFALDLVEAEYQYRAINGYVYMGFLLTPKVMWSMTIAGIKGLKFMLGQGTPRWLAARSKLQAHIASWEEKPLATLSSNQLMDGVRELMHATGQYYTVIQSGTLPTASSSEIIFLRVYKMAARKGDPEGTTLLFGLDSAPLKAEKSLFDLGLWLRNHDRLYNFVINTPSAVLCAGLANGSVPADFPEDDWREFETRLRDHEAEYGHTSFEFDFMNPTPAETPEILLEAVRVFAQGKGGDPYARQRSAEENRRQTINKIHQRRKLIPNRWFDKALSWALSSAPVREDSLADLGMAYTTIRRMLGEVGRRLVDSGALSQPEDIYWLIQDELDALLAGVQPQTTAWGEKISERKSTWQKQMKLIPPAVLPVTSRFARMVPWNRNNLTGKLITGLGASAGKVTARACVLFGPEDFHRMQPGDVLVAVTTTPAWTPLFALASAVVTDIGGPLSHSSIVAREYGIPAVLTTGIGTRRIQNGQMINVDGGKGTVELIS